MFQNINQIPKIRVCIRKRPVSSKEQQKGDSDIIDVQTNTVLVKEQKTKVDLTKYIEETPFNFDFAYDQFQDNVQIYNSAILPLVQATFQGSKTTCFAYGQTGSGKTYTMLGSQQNPGLYLLAAQDIFKYLKVKAYADMNLQISVSFYEIYCGKLFDLLNNKNALPVREDQKGNINIIGLSSQDVSSYEQLRQIIEEGMLSRVTQCNTVNNTSSRSHAILQIQIKQDGFQQYGQISFIDLAGNERGSDVSAADKKTRTDGAEISKSLLALKECIRALGQQKNHTPFRGSKLTLVLKDSFMNQKCKLVMIGNISPTQSSSDYTLNTLRYSDRVKELKKGNEQEAVDYRQFEKHLQFENEMEQEEPLDEQSNSMPSQFNKNVPDIPIQKNISCQEITYQQPIDSNRSFQDNYSQQEQEFQQQNAKFAQQEQQFNQSNIQQQQKQVQFQYQKVNQQNYMQQQPNFQQATQQQQLYNQQQQQQSFNNQQQYQRNSNEQLQYGDQLSQINQFQQQNYQPPEYYQLQNQKNQINFTLQQQETKVKSIKQQYINQMLSLIKQQLQIKDNLGQQNQDSLNLAQNSQSILQNIQSMTSKMQQQVQEFEQIATQSKQIEEQIQNIHRGNNKPQGNDYSNFFDEQQPNRKEDDDLLSEN